MIPFAPTGEDIFPAWGGTHVFDHHLLLHFRGIHACGCGAAAGHLESWKRHFESLEMEEMRMMLLRAHVDRSG
jgi:hypothetical protein